MHMHWQYGQAVSGRPFTWGVEPWCLVFAMSQACSRDCLLTTHLPLVLLGHVTCSVPAMTKSTFLLIPVPTKCFPMMFLSHKSPSRIKHVYTNISYQSAFPLLLCSKINDSVFPTLPALLMGLRSTEWEIRGWAVVLALPPCTV